MKRQQFCGLSVVRYLIKERSSMDEDTNELLGDIRAIAQYVISAGAEGLAESDDAIYLAELIQRLDDALCGDEEFPEDWVH